MHRVNLLLHSVLLLVMVAISQSIIAEPEFISSSSVAQVRKQITNLPKEDIWWVVNGEDMAWNFKNLHRIYPTVNIYRAGQVATLNYALNSEIGRYRVATPSGSMEFSDFINSELSTTMGLVILHEGEIVFESYPRMQPYEKPIYWSVTKVFVSAMVAILESKGLVDIDKPIDHYLSELAGSAFADIRIRNILDMATGLDCEDDYENKQSCYYRYSVAIGDGHFTDSSPGDPYTLIANMKAKRIAEQGTTYQYSGVNTFILGWLVEELYGMPFQDALTQEIWSRVGMESDASLLALRFGVPNTHGGLLARLRDVARFGLLYTPSYKKLPESQLLSDDYITHLLSGQGSELLHGERFSGQTSGGVTHRVAQWQVFENGDLFKGGWAGQGLLVNPKRDLVAVYIGYFKDDQSSETPLLPRLRAVLNGLYADL